MTLSQFILRLQALEENHGDSEVCITQSGYYAEGTFAELFDFPEVKKYSGDEYIILGHSHQSY